MAGGKAKNTTGREERTQALRQAIVDSAIGEFAAHGYGGASLRSIAARTGIELGHLGYHFSTKLELWQAAVATIFEAMPSVDAVPLPESADEARETITRLISEYSGFCMARPERVQIVFSESAAGGERLEWLAEHHLGRIVDGLNRHVAAAHRFGVLTSVDASIFIAALVGMSAINFGLPKLRDILLGGGLDRAAYATFISTILSTDKGGEIPGTGN
ncbi:MAG: TetR/AcrR family transcriptional regulator [Zavarzinia sp.]|nr:TetR/AcrR family transcriptional regulator [Zavarzinia sp.]